MEFQKITEKRSDYDSLETKSIKEILIGIHKEDQKAVQAIGKQIPKIETLIRAILSKLREGGRLFYIGAGTSGRLGVLDASECPPTFGTDPGMVIGLIAGGSEALYRSIENAEDDPNQGWIDLQHHQINENDFVVGIAASGTTPYVLGAIDVCRENNISTGIITCNPNSPLAQSSKFPVEVVVGPEFITGSTRMKAGTVQKLILNMITTSAMIKLGKVKGNKMIDIHMTNNKLLDRAVRILMEELTVDYKTAENLLKKHQSIRNAIKKYL